MGRQRGLEVGWQRFPVRDMDIPSRATMHGVLEVMAREPDVIYVHCWGGHGRTGTVARCYLVRQGMQVNVALAHIVAMRETDDYLRTQPNPQTPQQIAFIEDWNKAEDPASSKDRV